MVTWTRTSIRCSPTPRATRTRSPGPASSSSTPTIAAILPPTMARMHSASASPSMSADEQQNFEKIFEWSDGQRGQEELETPAEDLLRISPIFYLDRIQASLEVHHGGADP